VREYLHKVAQSRKTLENGVVEITVDLQTPLCCSVFRVSTEARTVAVGRPGVLRCRTLTALPCPGLSWACLAWQNRFSKREGDPRWDLTCRQVLPRARMKCLSLAGRGILESSALAATAASEYDDEPWYDDGSYARRSDRNPSRTCAKLQFSPRLRGIRGRRGVSDWLRAGLFPSPVGAGRGSIVGDGRGRSGSPPVRRLWRSERGREIERVGWTPRWIPAVPAVCRRSAKDRKPEEPTSHPSNLSRHPAKQQNEISCAIASPRGKVQRFASERRRTGAPSSEVH
jgi:hypothetical protein